MSEVLDAVGVVVGIAALVVLPAVMVRCSGWLCGVCHEVRRRRQYGRR